MDTDRGNWLLLKILVARYNGYADIEDEILLFYQIDDFKFMCYDQIGSTRQMSNVSGGTELKRDCWPYGVQEVASGDGINYLFSAKSLTTASVLTF